MIPILSTDLGEITRQMDDSRIPWAIFAGAAAIVNGSLRPLRDIDILIPSDAGKQLARSFPNANLEYRQDGSIAELRLPGCEIIAGLTKGISLQMDAAMIARIKKGTLLGVEVPVLSLEDNLVFKAVLDRGPEVGKHDWEDVAEMMSGATKLDWIYLCQRLASCATDRSGDLFARLKSAWENR